MPSPKLPTVRALFFAAQRTAETYWGGRDLDSRIMREQALSGASPMDVRLFDTFFVERVRVLLAGEGGLSDPGDGGPKPRAVRLAFVFGPVIG